MEVDADLIMHSGQPQPQPPKGNWIWWDDRVGICKAAQPVHQSAGGDEVALKTVRPRRFPGAGCRGGDRAVHSPRSVARARPQRWGLGSRCPEFARLWVHPSRSGGRI